MCPWTFGRYAPSHFDTGVVQGKPKERLVGETGKIRYEGKPTADSVLGRRFCAPERLVVSVRLFTRPQVGGS